MPPESATLDQLKARCGGLAVSEFRGETRVAIGRDQLLDAMTSLQQDRGFDLLVDVTCVDYLHYRDAARRFGLVYLLANTTTNERLTIRVYLDEAELSVPSMVSLWSGANWLEREAYDMFGIQFDGHPDLRRILMPEEFTAYPLRKDYPLQGRGERHNFQRIARAQA